MKTLKDLHTFIETHLLEQLQAMEARRRHNRKWMQWMWATCIIPFVIFTFFLLQHFIIAEQELAKHDRPAYWKMFSMAGIIFVFTLSCYGLRYYIRKKFEADDIFDPSEDPKEMLIKPIVEFLSSKYVYQSWNTITPEHFNEAKLFVKNPYQLSGRDLIYGTSGEAQFQYCHLVVKGEEKTEPVFNGNYFVAQFPATFQSSVYILSKDHRVEKLFDNGLIDIWSLGRKLLTNNQLFNKLFAVYAKDSVVAMNLLSDDLIKLLLGMQQRTKLPLYISFYENKVSVGIDFNKNYFEMDERREVEIREQLAAFYVEFNELIELSNILSRNVEIWSCRKIEIAQEKIFVKN